MYCVYAYFDGSGNRHTVSPPLCAEVMADAVAQGIRYFGTKQLEVRGDDLTPSFAPSVAEAVPPRPATSPGPISATGWREWDPGFLNEVETLLEPSSWSRPIVAPPPAVGGWIDVPATGGRPVVDVSTPVSPTGKPQAPGRPFTDIAGPVSPSEVPSPSLDSAVWLPTVGAPEPNPPFVSLPEPVELFPSVETPWPGMPEPNPPTGTAVAPEVGPRKGFFLVDPTRPYDPVTNPDTVLPAEPPKRGLAGPDEPSKLDLSQYDIEGLKQLCYRYGDTAACAYLAVQIGLHGTPEDTLNDPTPNPPTGTQDPKGTTQDPMAGTNSDGTPTAPDNPSSGSVDLDWFVNNRDKILGVVGGLADIFVPGNSTAPAPTAASPGPGTKELPWYRQIPFWVWLVLAGGGAYAISKSTR